MLLSSVLAPGFPRRIAPYLCGYLAICVFGVDSGITGSIQASDQWQSFFNYPTGSTLGLLNSISTLGLVAGNLIAPYVSDGLGRKKGLAIGAVIAIIGSALQAGSINITMYLIARFIVGLGIIFGHNPAPSYLTEFAPTKERALALGCYTPFYFVGSITISWTCYSTTTWPSSWSWRAPSLVQLVPSLLMLALLPFIPESPRWLVMKGRDEEAKQVLIKYHGCGEETEEVRLYHVEMVKSTRDQQALDNASSWKDLWSDKSRRIRLFIAVFAGISSQWSGNGLISYYIVTILKSVGIESAKDQTLFNGMLNVWSFLISLAAAPISQRFGRRPIFLVSITAMLLVWTCFTGLSAGYDKTGSSGMAAGVLAMIFLFQTTYAPAWSTLFMYPVELWPQGIRTRGMAAQNSLDYVALFFNIYANSIIIEKIAWRYYIVYIVIIAAQIGVVYYTFVETTGLSCEQICDYFDGKWTGREPKWLDGPKSKGLLLESQRLGLEHLAAQEKESDAESVDKATGDAAVVPVV